MGSLIYGVAPAIEISDRALRHLQAVIVAKLRRQESFTFSWGDEPDVDGDESGIAGRDGAYGCIWLSHSSSLYFSYDTPTGGPLNREWINALAQAASSGALRVLPEPPN